ncbi:retrovirus-related pol polyprotein from transposon TNT 1-94 [Tanacetum coccineum]
MATKFEIEKFNRNNFSLWKLKIKAILRKDKCLAAIDERPAEVTDDSKWEEMDENAITNLHLALADGVLSSIEKKKIFDHVVAAILEEENRRDNREDRQTSSRQVEALVVTRGRSMESGSSGSHNHGNVASTSEDGNAPCCEAAIANESTKRFTYVWLFDTGATFQMTIIGIGSIMVKMHDGTVRTIRDVRHVEGLKKNLLSLGQLDDHGVLEVLGCLKMGKNEEKGCRVRVASVRVLSCIRVMDCLLDEGRVDIVVSKWFMWERDSLGVKIIVAFCLESNPRSRELVDVYGIYVSLLEVCVMRSNSEWDAPILNGYPSEVSVPSGSCVRQVGDVEEECRSSLYVRLTMMEVKVVCVRLAECYILWCGNNLSMGFSSKWISWISGCLSSAKSSVLVNGSLTDEFHLHRGLRQGEPLSLFLFIMIMEGLHVAVEDAILAGYFRGVTLGYQNIPHLLFADDVLFLGEWSRSNVINLVNLLQ